MADVMTALAAAKALCQAKTALWDPIANKIATSDDMEDIYTALHDAVSMLGAKREDHLNTLQRHKMNTSSTSYKEWIRRVKKTEEEVKKLQSKYDKQKDSSRLICFYPRSDLSKEMKIKGGKVLQLLEESTQLQIFIDPPPEPIIKLTAPDLKKFPTLRGPLEAALNFLKNDQVNGISIFGMMGSGKTAIMRNLNNHEEVAKMFGIVLWIKVSTEESEDNLPIEQLQKAIGERLKVDVTGSDNFDSISQSIKKELTGKKYLLLLDDVKDDLDVYQTGIPECDNGSKIVLTTRWRHICSQIVDQVVRVSYLTAPESWRMFQDIINRPDLINHSSVGPLVWRIVDECGGHPLLIRTVANVFRMKDDEKLWTEGFNSLKRFSEKERRGMMEMFRVIKFCFDDLEENERKCFLYGALYPEDSPVHTDHLLECWEAEDFLGISYDTREGKIKGNHILKHLKNKSLLEEGEGGRKYVSMHKCIRQVALYIAADDAECKHLVKNNWTLPTIHSEEWKDKNWISLVDIKSMKLPEFPDCGELSTLFLQKNSNLNCIPLSFFASMGQLKVLDLCHAGIGSLPLSFSNLISLKVLYLSYCSALLQLPSNIGELEFLEVLDIRGSGVKNIPSYISKIKGLRRLRVSFFSPGNENEADGVSFNCNVISELSLLEELVIDVESPEKWSNQVVEHIIRVVATLKKLVCLQFLFSNEVVDVIEVLASSIRIHVPDMNILRTFIKETSSWRNIQDFQIFQFFIGCERSKQPQIPEFYQYKRYVKSCIEQGIDQSIFEVLSVDAFELVNYHNIKQLSELSIPSLNQIRGCLIESCSGLETALDDVTAPNLEHLYFKNSEKLRHIWSNQVKVVTVTKLKTLVLTSCHVLRNIFPLVVIQQLCEIEYLKVEDCPEIVEIVEYSASTVNMGLLPKLKKLILLSLPKLEGICVKELSKWTAMEKLKVRNCPALKTLPFSKDDREKMKLVKAEKDWLDALQ